MSSAQPGPLEGQVVLITGAGRGIGKACASAFGRAGARVALCDIDLQGASAAAADLSAQGITAHAWSLDVRDREGWGVVVDQIEQQWGPVQILVGNAGIMPVGPVLELDLATEQRQIDINLLGLIHGVHAVLPGMLERGAGHFVHIASIAGRIPTPYAAVYAATKFGAVGLTEALRHELDGTGVHLSSIMPGFVETELISGLARPAWPKPSTPEAVAAASVKAVLKNRGRVYLPWFGGILCMLPWVLPHSLNIWLAKCFKVNKLLKPIDPQARQGYRQRTRGDT